MPTRILRRPVLAFALGLAVACAAFAGSAAYGALSSPNVSACYVPKTGSLYVVGRDGAPARCADGHLAIDWSQQGAQGPVGPQGPSGVFSGTFTSPNGLYSISVTNAGIRLDAPLANVRLTAGSISVDGGGLTSIRGATVQLNGAAGCSPLTRLTDPIPVPEHAGVTFPSSAASTVCAG